MLILQHTWKSIQNELDLTVRTETIKLFKENTREKFITFAFAVFPAYDAKSTSNKGKNRQVRPYQTKKLLYSKLSTDKVENRYCRIAYIDWVFNIH